MVIAALLTSSKCRKAVMGLLDAAIRSGHFWMMEGISYALSDFMRNGLVAEVRQAVDWLKMALEAKQAGLFAGLAVRSSGSLSKFVAWFAAQDQLEMARETAQLFELVVKLCPNWAIGGFLIWRRSGLTSTRLH